MSELVRDLLESLAQCVFTRLELLDVRLQILTHPFDTRECPLAGERGLRLIIVLGIQLLLIRLFDPRDSALKIKQNVVRNADVLVEGRALLPMEEVSQNIYILDLYTDIG